MAKIRKISYGDIFQVKKLISVVCSDNVMSYRRLFFCSVPITHIQNLLYDLRLRTSPETYVISDNAGNLKGVITVEGQKGNPYKRRIRRFFLDKSAHEEGRQLVDYIAAKFGARGADTFYVCFNDTQTELIELFVKGCGFRMCSSEELRCVSNINFLKSTIDERTLIPFKNSDAEKTAALFNETLTPHYKYSLQKRKEEFYSDCFPLFASDYSFKYILEGSSKNTISGFLEIKTADNSSYFIDIIVPPSNFELYSDILSFAVKKIVKRSKNSKLYIKNKKYMQTGAMIENFAKENRFELLQNNAVLVRDFFKTAKEDSKNFSEAAIFQSFEI